MDSELLNASIINKDGTIIPKRISKDGRCCASHLEILTGVSFEDLPRGFDLWKYQFKALSRGMIRVVKEKDNVFDMTFVLKPTKEQFDVIRRFEEQISDAGGVMGISILRSDKNELFYKSDGNWANTVMWITSVYETEKRTSVNCK